MHTHKIKKKRKAIFIDAETHAIIKSWAVQENRSMAKQVKDDYKNWKIKH